MRAMGRARDFSQLGQFEKEQVHCGWSGSSPGEGRRGGGNWSRQDSKGHGGREEHSGRRTAWPSSRLEMITLAHAGGQKRRPGRGPLPTCEVTVAWTGVARDVSFSVACF